MTQSVKATTNRLTQRLEELRALAPGFSLLDGHGTDGTPLAQWRLRDLAHSIYRLELLLEQAPAPFRPTNVRAGLAALHAMEDPTIEVLEEAVDQIEREISHINTKIERLGRG